AGMSGRPIARAAQVHASLASLAPRALPPLTATGSVLVLPTLFTTSEWRKSMPGRNAIGHAGAHTSACSGCYVRPTAAFSMYIGLPTAKLPRGRPFGTALQPGSRLAAAAT